MSRPIDLDHGANAVIREELNGKDAVRLNLRCLSDRSGIKDTTLSTALVHLERHGVVVIEQRGAGRRAPLVRLAYD